MLPPVVAPVRRTHGTQNHIASVTTRLDGGTGTHLQVARAAACAEPGQAAGHHARCTDKAKAAAHVELRRNGEASAAYINIWPCKPSASQPLHERQAGRPQRRGGPDGALGVAALVGSRFKALCSARSCTCADLNASHTFKARAKPRLEVEPASSRRTALRLADLAADEVSMVRGSTKNVQTQECCRRDR